MEFIAHVRKDENDNWAPPHLLKEHLISTGDLAGKFASKFDSGIWGELAGICHDAGKGRKDWQHYLRLKSGFDEEAHLEGKPGKVPHAIHGAKLVEEIHGLQIGRIMSYCIAGHHVGLQDWGTSEGAGQGALEYQLSQISGLEKIDQFIWDEVKRVKPTMPPWKFSSKGLDISLWIRMLYSCLVDADFLDTETYMDQEKASLRHGYCTIPELLKRLNSYNDVLVNKSNGKHLPINQIRNRIRKRCVDMAKEDQGVFSLSVPTGGGKTLSSLAFGLEHAQKHSLDRVIYVIPYTSIIEQNAEVFRKALGHDQVVEHHSSLIENDITPRLRLSSENWDAPVIVTTSVQFFESLFSARSSRCRKLHNIINSVVILDEAQLVPVEYLSPILETMQLLVDKYSVSFVICTATQPAFKDRAEYKFQGLRDVREIIGDEKEVSELYRSLKRVNVEYPDDLDNPSTWDEIAEQLIDYEQVLCVVSDRKSCRELHALMPKYTYHLSALMCGQHRSEIIKEISYKLKNNQPCRVISTQLVEAGVDLDFPVVYRAFAGLDSIAQAAGRCNREGKLPDLGVVKVFVPPKRPPVGHLRKAAETLHVMLSSMQEVDPLDHAIFYPYFSELYWKAISLDSKDIIPLLEPTQTDMGIYFRTASERFQIIDSSRQKTILVRYGKGNELIDLLKYKGPDRNLMRQLQRYSVNVYTEQFNAMLMRGSIEAVQPEIYALTSEIEYNKTFGLMVDEIVF